jgi:predicted transcriptional regulator
MKTLKAPESVVYDYVASYAREHGRGPSYREIARALSVGTTTVKTRMDSLAAQGLVERSRLGPRSGTMPVVRPSRQYEVGTADGCRVMRCGGCGGKYAMALSTYVMCPLCGARIATSDE